MRDNAGKVREWGISQTTLEEVFLRLIREVNPTATVAAIKSTAEDDPAE